MAAAAWSSSNRTPNDLREHRARVQEYARERKQLHRLRREPTRTLDGVDIKLWANAESREDVAEAHALGAAGVGLYRTEFLFMQRPADARMTLPDEDEQFRAYRDLVLGMTGRTVTIRTLDIGADKADGTALALPGEPNPAMGLRGVRLSLARDALFRTQLRAILRASAYGPVRVLIPMVSGREEVIAVRARIKDVQRELRAEGHAIAENRAGRRDDRSALGRDRAADLHRCGGFPLDRHQRPGAVPARRRPQQRRAGRAVFAAASCGAAPDPRRDPRRAHAPTSPWPSAAKWPAIRCSRPVLLALGLEEFSLHPGTLLELRRAIRSFDLGCAARAQRDACCARATAACDRTLAGAGERADPRER